MKGVVRVELRQMSGIDEARSNTDTQLGCNKTSSSPQQRLVCTVGENQQEQRTSVVLVRKGFILL